jgi:hypothetical protein
MNAPVQTGQDVLGVVCRGFDPGHPLRIVDDAVGAAAGQHDDVGLRAVGNRIIVDEALADDRRFRLGDQEHIERAIRSIGSSARRRGEHFRRPGEVEDLHSVVDDDGHVLRVAGGEQHWRGDEGEQQHHGFSHAINVARDARILHDLSADESDIAAKAAWSAAAAAAAFVC